MGPCVCLYVSKSMYGLLGDCVSKGLYACAWVSKGLYELFCACVSKGSFELLCARFSKGLYELLCARVAEGLMVSCCAWVSNSLYGLLSACVSKCLYELPLLALEFQSVGMDSCACAWVSNFKVSVWTLVLAFKGFAWHIAHWRCRGFISSLVLALAFQIVCVDSSLCASAPVASETPQALDSWSNKPCAKV